MGRVLVVNGLLKRLLLRMRLLLERLLLLRKHLQQPTKRHRPCCAVEAGARCRRLAALLRLPLAELRLLQRLRAQMLMLMLIVLFLWMLGMLPWMVVSRTAGSPDCSERIRPTPAGSNAR